MREVSVPPVPLLRHADRSRSEDELYAASSCHQAERRLEIPSAQTGLCWAEPGDDPPQLIVGSLQ